MKTFSYAGFWVRVVASVIDTVLILAISWPLLGAIYGPQSWQTMAASQGMAYTLISYVLPALAVIVFWVYKSATPGKMAMGLVIVDAKTGEKPSIGQLIGRYFAYYVSIIPLFMGIFWVAFDKRKQGFHDKLAGTVVIRKSAEAKKLKTDEKVKTETARKNSGHRKIQSVERTH